MRCNKAASALRAPILDFLLESYLSSSLFLFHLKILRSPIKTPCTDHTLYINYLCRNAIGRSPTFTKEPRLVPFEIARDVAF